MAELDKVIKGLERCLVCDTSVIAPEEGQKAYIDCEYTVGLYCRRDRVLREAIDMLNEYKQLQGLAQGNGLTKCKDCEWRGNKKKCIVAFVADKQEFPFFFYDNHGEWYCADGKPKNRSVNALNKRILED